MQTIKKQLTGILGVQGTAGALGPPIGVTFLQYPNFPPIFTNPSKEKKNNFIQNRIMPLFSGINAYNYMKPIKSN